MRVIAVILQQLALLLRLRVFNMTIYSDINFRVSVQPKQIVTDADAVNQNIAAIFDTPVRSKWFRPRIGSNINSYLFEPIDDITADNIRREMEIALESNGEFRVIFNTVQVIPDPDNQQYYVEISYTAPELEKQNQTFKFNLQRGIIR